MNQLTDVLRAHERTGPPFGDGRYRDESLEECECDGVGQYGDYPAHVAAAVQESLNLREEFTWSWPAELTGTGQPGVGYSVATRAEAVAEADPYMTIVSRYATPWRPSQSGDTNA